VGAGAIETVAAGGAVTRGASRRGPHSVVAHPATSSTHKTPQSLAADSAGRSTRAFGMAGAVAVLMDMAARAASQAS